MEISRVYHFNKVVIALVILVITVIFGSACVAANEANEPAEPQDSGLVIRYLTASKQVEPLKGTHILCVATDEGDSVLKYEWSATGGKIEVQKEPDDILWLAPDKTGNYTITAVVTNAKGVKATKSVNMLVTNEPPQYPEINSVTCQDCKNGIEASRRSQYMIKCDASDPNGDPLQYTWFASIGKIKGEGHYATWYTLAQYGNALITVIVTDDKGNKTEGYLAVNVKCCN